MDRDYDPHDRAHALEVLARRSDRGEVATGLFYLDPEASDTHDILGTVDTPLSQLTEAELCPGNAVLQDINASMR